MNLNKPIKKLFSGFWLMLALLSLTFSQLSLVQAQSNGTISFDLPATPPVVGDTFTVDVIIDSGGETLNVATAYIEFDANVLQVTDQTINTDVFPFVLPPIEGAGTLIVSGGAVSPPFPSGNFTFATIEFEAIAASTGTQLTFNTTDPANPTQAIIQGSGGQVLPLVGTPAIFEVQAANEAPTADAGPEQTVTDTDDNGSEDVTLDGSGSSDDDGTIASYVWSEDGQEIATGPTPTVSFSVGTHTVTLTVTDDDGESDTDEVVITVNAPANEAPTADAGPDQTVTDTDGNGSEDVMLDGSGSSDDSGIVSYVWSEGGQEIATGETPMVNFSVGTHTVTLEVTDDDSATDTDTVEITVNPPGQQDDVFLTFVPEISEVRMGDTFTVTVQVEAGSQLVSGVEAYVDFDPAVLEAISLDRGETFTDVLPYRIDNNTGEIDYAAGLLGDSASGTFDLVTIEFLAQDETIGSDLTFAFDGNRTTEAALSGFSVLTGVTNGQVIITSNSVPLANDDSVTTDEDTPVNITLTANDADDDDLTYSVEQQPTNGTLSGTPPDLTYTPDPNFNGSDSFTFKANDGTEDSNTANVDITVNAVNDAPVAVDDNATTDEDFSVDVEVLDNDSDVDEDTLSVANVIQPANGTAGINPDNTISYTPDADFCGADSFTYTVSDNNTGEDTATVDVTVNCVNDAPLAENDSFIVQEDSAATLPVLSNDSDADEDTLNVASVTDPTNGSVTNNDTNVSYTPNAAYCGPDSFSYTVNDGIINGNTATVDITVECVNDAPVANDDSVTTDEDTPVNITLTASDADDDDLTYSVEQQPTNGTLSGTPPDLTYTPDPDFNGSDSFTFKANDGTEDSNTANVDITVNEVPEAIIIGSVTLEGRATPPGAAWSVPLTVNLYDVGAPTPAYKFTPTTDNNGQFILNEEIDPGEYEIAVKNSHTLQTVTTITLVDGDNEIDFGTLREGDANNDNSVNILDFTILSDAFGTSVGQLNFDSRTNFNEDEEIDILDFTLLSDNFSEGGEEVSGLEP